MFAVNSVSAYGSKTLHSLTVKDVLVDLFWSFTVHNADRYRDANILAGYRYNNFAPEPDDDGPDTYTRRLRGLTQELHFDLARLE